MAVSAEIKKNNVNVVKDIRAMAKVLSPEDVYNRTAGHLCSEIERLRKRTHEIQEKCDKQAAKDKSHIYWHKRYYEAGCKTISQLLADKNHQGWGPEMRIALGKKIENGEIHIRGLEAINEKLDSDLTAMTGRAEAAEKRVKELEAELQRAYAGNRP